MLCSREWNADCGTSHLSWFVEEGNNLGDSLLIEEEAVGRQSDAYWVPALLAVYAYKSALKVVRIFVTDDWGATMKKALALWTRRTVLWDMEYWSSEPSRKRG
jgi:hypothetical protein